MTPRKRKRKKIKTRKKQTNPQGDEAAAPD